MCDADEYIKRKPESSWNGETFEILRRGTIRILLVVVGACALLRGCFEGALEDGDGFMAIVFAFGGLYCILAAFGKEGG